MACDKRPERPHIRYFQGRRIYRPEPGGLMVSHCGPFGGLQHDPLLEQDGRAGDKSLERLAPE